MQTSIQDRVEKFLSCANYIALIIKEDKQITLLFDSGNVKKFSEVENYRLLKTYWKGKRMKFVIVTNEPELDNDYISFVDVNSGDTINLKGPKFINGNIHKFFESNVPNDTVFNFLILGKSADNDTLLLPPILSEGKPLKIHGYSVTDNRMN